MSPLKPRGASHVATDITTPRTLAERAYLSLRNDVICGKLAPGEKLRVEHLKDQYQVGASTLREALSLLVSDALVSAEGQRGFRVAPISLTDLEDVTNTRVMLETEALRQSIRNGDAQWEAALTASYQLLTQTESQSSDAEPLLWEARNKAFHEALIAGHQSPWTKYMLSILYRHGERYRKINWRLTAAHATDRRVHDEHETIYQAAITRQDARAALALEAHIRLTHDIVKRETRLT
ncbi:FCD domain-containing protein [Rhodoferax sp. 4810]|nr:FCD domain-containing protein [Rhodoferax jenense]